MLKIICLLSLFFIDPIFAKEIEIKFLKGKALVNNSPLSKQSTLKYGDTIKTKKNSIVILVLENYSTIKINEKSVLKLSAPKKFKSGKTRRGAV